MRFLVLSLMAALLAPQVGAQQQWRQLPGAAKAYAVDLHSLVREGGVLSARIRTHDVGSRIIVQQVEVRCLSRQLRTIDEKLYDGDTGRPLPPIDAADAARSERGSVWPEYEAGSEGHALLSGLCALARERDIPGPTEDSVRGA
jgi:hypothetical protein